MTISSSTYNVSFSFDDNMVQDSLGNNMVQRTSWTDLCIDVIKHIFEQVLDCKSLKPRLICKAWKILFDQVTLSRLTSFSRLPIPLFSDLFESLKKDPSPLPVLQAINERALEHSERKLWITTQDEIEQVQNEVNTALLQIWSRIINDLNVQEPVPTTPQEIYGWLKDPKNAPLLGQIRWLDLSDLPISFIPVGVLQNMSNLTTLSLSNTPISNLPHEIEKLPQLRRVYLSPTGFQNIRLRNKGFTSALLSKIYIV